MKPGCILRWTARIWGVASTVLLMAFAFGGHEHLRLTLREAVAFLFFPMGVVVGFVVAWRRELVGGLISVGSLALFYLHLWAGGRPVGPYFLLFAAPGFLHLVNALCFERKSK
jgi:glucose-6-phosphate-specific signal transduction histidine kinase